MHLIVLIIKKKMFVNNQYIIFLLITDNKLNGYILFC